MARFLIEVPHESNFVACERAIRVFLDTGSHFLSHADWGCKDGVHKAWLIVEVESKEQAFSILPAAYRNQALIVELNAFTLPQIDEMARQHAGNLQ